MIETIRNQRPSPCKGCPDRYTACSDHCEKPAFLKWKQEQETIRKNKKAYYSGIWNHQEADPNAYRARKRFR